MKRKLIAVGVVALVLALLLTMAPACGNGDVEPTPGVTLPEGAIKVTDVVPGMGEHWADPAQMPPLPMSSGLLGPVYVAFNGEVIGIEYLWTEDIMQEIPTPEGLLFALAPLPVGVTVDYIDVAFMEFGHPGIVEVPHWDIHIYFIPKAEVDAITP